MKAESCVSRLKAELQKLQVSRRPLSLRGERLAGVRRSLAGGGETHNRCVCVCVFQEEADALRSENVSLKAAESEAVVAMRHNAQVASEYLNKTASHAHSSIRSVCVRVCKQLH